MIKKLSVWSGDHWVGLEKETASQTIFFPHIHICQKKSQLHLFQDNRKTQNASKNDQRWHNLPQVLVRIIESLDTLIDILTMHYGLLRPLTFLSGKKRKPSSLNCTSALQSPCVIFIRLSHSFTSMSSISRYTGQLGGSLNIFVLCWIFNLNDCFLPHAMRGSIIQMQNKKLLP